jgi:NAD(P)-dependent dehydrogenase (short-subunit alcohol dehydrogenase family)
MQEFRGRVAVITGAASGIGFALAERAANEGMKVVLADIETAALENAVASLTDRGFAAIGHRLDVSAAEEVEALAKRAFDEFGAVHLLCNNAGVINHERPTWEHTIADWEWLIAVNLWGVIHGLRAFVPRMLASGEEGHIVNTASMAGLITGRTGAAVYDATKHAVVSLSESLYRDLVIEQDRVNASVLCPGGVLTNIFTAERNRPGGSKEAATTVRPAGSLPPDAFPPEEMANRVFEAVRDNRFYILAAQPEILEFTKMGQDRMWEGKNPAVSRSLIAAREARKAGSS